MDPQPPQPAPVAENRPLRFGVQGADDSRRSPDEIRIIGEMAREEVETFLVANPTLDSGAADQLRREPPHIQLAVVDRGPLRHCREPSGVVITRIRMAKNGTLGGPNSQPPSKYQATGDNAERRPAADGLERKELKVKKLYVGALIGKGGENIKAMNTEAGCKIGIDQKDESSDEATVIIGPGTPEQLASGWRLVMSRIQELDAKGKGKPGGFGGGKGAPMGVPLAPMSGPALMLGSGCGLGPPGMGACGAAGGAGMGPCGGGGAGMGPCGGSSATPMKSINDQALQDEAFSMIHMINSSS